jgi:type IV secretory pathway VirB10-like protein
MADERDPKLSQHYRSLEPLEPPAALDQKILAAAREAAESPHAPLVAPGGRHRWYYGLAAAAVLVFAVALTLHLERDRPDPEAGPPLRMDRELRGQIKQAPKADAAPREAAPAPRTPAPTPRADEQRIRAGQAATERALRSEAQAAKQQAAASRLAGGSAAAPLAAAPENPDRWLERIAELRSRGRHADADRELAAFRKAYPNYALSEVMRERVEGTVAPR